MSNLHPAMAQALAPFSPPVTFPDIHEDYLALTREGLGLARTIEQDSSLEEAAQVLELINAVARNPRLESCVKVNSIVAALDALDLDMAERYMQGLESSPDLFVTQGA